MEIWKDVKNYEGLYQVSSEGRVKSLKFGKDRILKQSPNGCVYLTVGLHKEGKQKTIKVHKLIAIAFLNHIPDGHKIVCDHIDNNKLNNRLENLQLITHRENTSKDKKGGTSQFIGVCWYKVAKKWRADIWINGKLKHLGLFTSELEASKAYQKALKSI